MGLRFPKDSDTVFLVRQGAAKTKRGLMKRFGVELEWVGDFDRILTQLRDAGLRVLDNRHTHNGFSQTDWTLKYDGSVSRGGELVSPPLDFDNEAERAQVTTAVQALQDAGAQPDQSAGIHVHIEAKHEDGRPLSAREIAAVVRFTYKFEDAIYRIASSGWERIRGAARTYAKPIPEATAQAIMKVKTLDELQNVWDGQALGGTRARRQAQYGVNARRSLDRYTGTNLRAFFNKGTIEFRYFNSSVNPVRVQTYIALCMAIVDDARLGYSRSVKKSYRLGSMANGEVSEKALFLRLQQILRTKSRDSDIIMSTEDWKNLRKLCWNGSKAQQGGSA